MVICCTMFVHLCYGLQKVKVSHSLIAIRAVGVRVLSLVQLMKGGHHPSPFTALPFPYLKKVPITARLTERVTY